MCSSTSNVRMREGADGAYAAIHEQLHRACLWLQRTWLVVQKFAWKALISARGRAVRAAPRVAMGFGGPKLAGTTRARNARQEGLSASRSSRASIGERAAERDSDSWLAVYARGIYGRGRLQHKS